MTLLGKSWIEDSDPMADYEMSLVKRKDDSVRADDYDRSMVLHDEDDDIIDYYDGGIIHFGDE